MGCKQTSSKSDKNAKAEDKSKSKPPEPKKKEEEPKQEPPKEATEYIIQVTFKSKLLWQKTFPIETTALKVIEEFKKDMPQYKVTSESKWTINDADAAQLILTKTLKDLQPFASSLNEIRFSLESKGLDIPQLDLLNKFKDGLDFLGKPVLNPFSLIIFSKTMKSLELYPLSDLMVTDHLLNLYTQTGSYCNGANHLFLSGGEKEGQLESHVWSINLHTKDILVTTQAMLPKKHHSMIFINTSYVFIVGGNTKDVFFYDTAKNTLVNWGILNADRIEPTLSLINNAYLYCFSNLNKELSFEMTDLCNEPHWQLIIPKINPGLQFTQKYFGVVNDSASSLIFVGGYMTTDSSNQKCFRYDAQSHELEESAKDFSEIDLIEKAFVAVNSKWSCLIPNCSEKNMSIILFNNQSHALSTVHFREGHLEGLSGLKKQQPSLSQSLLVDVNQINLNMPQ